MPTPLVQNEGKPSHKLFNLLQQKLEVFLNVDGLKLLAVALERLPVRPDQELLKIPRDVRA